MSDHQPSHPGFNPVNDTLLTRESWKIFQIMAEFVEGFERLARIKPSVSLFGSARVAPEHPYYALAERIARALSDAGFSVVSGGGPGIMEAVNKGAFAGPSPSIGLNIDLPREQAANEYQDISLQFRHFFARSDIRALRAPRLRAVGSRAGAHARAVMKGASRRIMSCAHIRPPSA